MLEWFSENIGTVAAAAGLIVLVAAIITAMIKNKRKGRSSCGCNCAHCGAKSAESSCHKPK